ncbi:hypothetical protein [Kibdelosporangium phytohabitans]|uniref:Uncharacterized protein n=1 Tax=Kibdelosporangium phytohabitans TaxID=860235 RepID=A0A0N7F3Z7_9PSEU|nr:hypothetical protein [Kibdelosporangium phytohabitans]ALG10023.1 hypothetical protein AOZ06_26785 [Kibdelosporangium phytohabitans]MBE1468547.1 hypothetical protein [Kibdelosporangium phytohabitans]
MKHYRHPASEFAGAVVHARELLAGSGEPVLWAAFAQRNNDEERGFGATSMKILKAPAKAATVVYEEMTVHEGGRPSGPPPSDVTAFYYPDRKLAADYSDKIPVHDTLWALTPRRLHVAKRLDPPKAVDEFPHGPPDPKDESWLDTDPKEGEQFFRSQRKQRLYPLRPVVDIPRAQIAKFTVDADGALKKRHCLRMELVDGSGFEFYFGLSYPREHYEHLLALTLGAPETS